MTSTTPVLPPSNPVPQPPAAIAAAPVTAPSLRAPWLQALIRAGAQLSNADCSATEVRPEARDAVHYVRCSASPGAVGPDFLSAMAQARRLVALGARRIVFLTDGDHVDDRLYQSLHCFSRHSARALSSQGAEFAVIPVHHPEAARAL